MSLVDLLRLPDAVDADELDAADASEAHRRIIQSKPFPKRVYLDSFAEFLTVIAGKPDGVYVELGSGGGFLKEIAPGVTTSDVVELPGVDLCFSASDMPFDDASLQGIFMLNCFHHLPRPAEALLEFQRALAPGGRVLMTEPANTAWARFVYTHFHHELFDPNAEWELEGTGRLSSANDALPWIVFVRDLRRMQATAPALEVMRVEYHTPLRYLLSGGLSFRQLAPSWSYGAVSFAERLASPLNRHIGMFMTVELRRA